MITLTVFIIACLVAGICFRIARALLKTGLSLALFGIGAVAFVVLSSSLCLFLW